MAAQSATDGTPLRDQLQAARGLPLTQLALEEPRSRARAARCRSRASGTTRSGRRRCRPSTRGARSQARLVHRKLEADLDDLEALEEMAAEDDSIAGELEEHARLGARRGSTSSRRQRLFSGPYDAGDAVVSVHAGAGGTDSQDWAEMLLRMEMRWAERRGFKVELARGERGGGGRHQVGHLHRARRERVRPVQRGEGRAPAGADLAVRRAGAPPHERSRWSRSRRWSTRSPTSTSTSRTCRSTPTARRAPAAST